MQNLELKSISGLEAGPIVPLVDRIWGIWGPYYNIPKAILYLHKGDYIRTCWEAVFRDGHEVFTTTAPVWKPPFKLHTCVHPVMKELSMGGP